MEVEPWSLMRLDSSTLGCSLTIFPAELEVFVNKPEMTDDIQVQLPAVSNQGVLSSYAMLFYTMHEIV